MATQSASVPIEHLDFDYIRECTDDRELERILKVLRSGKEGHYPDLMRCAEAQLTKIKPKSLLLREEGTALHLNDLNHSERSEIQDDLQNWQQAMNAEDSTLRRQGANSAVDFHTPVRGSQDATNSSDSEKSNSTDSSAAALAADVSSSSSSVKLANGTAKEPSKQSIPSYDYAAWDKFDANAAAGKVDGDEAGKKPKVSAKPSKQNKAEPKLTTVVNTEGLSSAQCERLSVVEKEKGNEAFRAGDYSEAMVFYTRSINYQPSCPAHNNRAATALKLQKYQQAEDDASWVLVRESSNVKALLRRAEARQYLWKFVEALADVESALKLEPKNRKAKEMKPYLEREARSKGAGKPANSKPEEDGKAKKKGRRLVVTEVEGEASANGGKSSLPACQKDKDPRSSAVTNSQVADGKSATEKKSLQNGLPTAGNSMATIGEATADAQTDRQHPVEEAARAPGQVGGEQTPTAQPVEAEEDPPAKVLTLKKKGNDFFQAGDYASALEKYSAALNGLHKGKYPKMMCTLYNNRAACYLKLGDCRLCVDDCSAVLEQQPANSKAWLRRAAAYEMREKYADAYADYQQAIFIDPTNCRSAQAANTRLLPLLMDAYGRAWRSKLPQRPVVSAVRTSPLVLQPEGLKVVKPSLQPSDGNFPSETFPDAPVKQSPKPSSNDQTEDTDGMPLLDDKDREMKTTQTPDELFEILKKRGNDFVKKGQYDEASYCYSNCISAMPRQAVAYCNRAFCYLKLGKPQFAESDCHTALQLDRNNIKALFRQAQARKELKRYRDAIESLQRLLAIDDQNSAARKELEAVKKLAAKVGVGKVAERKQAAAAEAAVPKQAALSSSKASSDASPGQRRQLKIEEVDADSEEEVETMKETEAPKVSPSSSTASAVNDTDGTCGGSTETPSAAPTKEKAAEDQQRPAKKDSPTTTLSEETKPSKPVTLKETCTAFEFLQAWNSIRHGDKLAQYAALLRQVPAERYPQLVGHKLDDSLLTSIVRVVHQHFLPAGEYSRSHSTLMSLSKMKRFDTVYMFLGSKEKEELKSVFNELASNTGPRTCAPEDVQSLRAKFDV